MILKRDKLKKNWTRGKLQDKIQKGIPKFKNNDIIWSALLEKEFFYQKNSGRRMGGITWEK